MRHRTVATITLSVIVGLLVIVCLAVVVLTGTDWGRERVRRIALAQLSKAAHGIVKIEGVGGNLLHGATLTGVSITDSSGAPFITMDTLVANYGLGVLVFSKHINLRDVRLVHPVIVLSRKTGGAWNYDHIFPRDTVPQPPSAPGYGSWITLTNVTVVDGHITLKSPWAPSDTLTATQRDSAVTFALGPLSRPLTVRADTGFQMVSDFRDIFGKFPLMRIADPKDQRQIYDVTSLQMTADPMKPPSVRVTNTAGRFVVLNDSLYFSGIRAALASSRFSGSGRYRFSNNDLRLRLHVDTVNTNDLLWIDPSIPENGTGKMDFALDWVGPKSDYAATNASLAVAGATLAGKIGVLMTDTVAFHDTDVRVSHLDTRTVQQLFPILKSPRQGYLTGRMAARGGFGAMQIDGDVAFDDPRTGRSRVIADGTVGAIGTAFRADNLHITLAPLQVALAQAMAPTFPIDGTLTGTVVIDGSTDSRLVARGDLTHEAETGTSHIVGSGAYASEGRVPLMNADLQLLPLSLATVGTLAPAAGLRGTVTGPVKLTGPMRNLAIDARLTTPDSGWIAATGTLDLASAEQGYDMVTDAHLFDASQVSSHAPSTSITAHLNVQGTGLDPATLHAVATAQVLASQVDSVALDSAALRVSAANGVARIDTLAVNVPTGYASAAGDFGLTQSSTGTLKYVVNVDSLGAFTRFLPPDTTSVRPRPGILARRRARARADSARMAEATEVERAVTGRRAPRVVIDTPTVIPRGTLSGSLRTEGSMTGNIHTLDIDGTADGRNIVALGNSVQAATVHYAWKTAFAPASHISAEGSATRVMVSGFALDTVRLVAGYSKPSGTVNIVINEDSSRTYTLGGAFTLNKIQNEVQLDNLKLRFDTTVYASTHPSVIHFGESGIEVEDFEITNPRGSRVYANGVFPTTGPIDADVHVTQFDVGNLVALMQSAAPARGLVSVDLHAEGTRASPVIRGAFGVTRFSYAGRPTPELHGVVNYADQTLHADISGNREGKSAILTARGTVPVNLALTNVRRSRIPRRRTIDATIVTDSLPLELVPQVTDVAADLRGRALARFTVAGTAEHPLVDGHIALWDGAVRVIPLGVTLSRMAANVRLVRDTVIIDSVVARSDGQIRLSGGVGIQTLAQPSFALKLTARNAEIVDNDNGRIHASADIAVQGPFKAVDVTGRARILDGVAYIPEPTGKTLVSAGDPALFSILDTANTGQRDLFPTESPLLANMRMNVALSVSRDVFVRSRDANVEVYTDGPLNVSMDRSKNSIVLDGVLLSDRGEYRFQGRRFQVRHGSATFVNTTELNPTLQITGEYNIQLPTTGATTISIIISGTLDQPKIALSSDAQPPIAQTDLLSFLAFGRSSSSLLQQEGSALTSGGSGASNLVGAGAAFAAKQVGSAALGAVADEVSGDAARSLGADVFNIAPADVSLDAASFLRGTQVEFGKYIQRRTFFQIQVRPDPSSLKRPGFQLIHRFSNRGDGYRIEASFEPRYLLKQPSLSADQNPQTTSAFGLFLIRQWRY